MSGGWRVVCLIGGLMVTAVCGQTVPCMKTREACERTGYSSISIVNNNYRCCAPGYSMSMVNSLCSCTKYADAIPCSEGPCMSGVSMGQDWLGRTQCCPPGYSMSSQSSIMNGRQSSSCSCTKLFMNGGGSSSIFIGNGMDFNSPQAEAMSRNMNAWGRQFQQQMNRQMAAMTGQIAGNLQRVRSQLASTLGRLGYMFP